MFDRRGFLGALLAACVLPADALYRPGQVAPLRVGLLLPAGEGSAARGVELGAEEASRTGALVGRALEMRTAAPGGAEALLREWGPAALVGGLDEASVRADGALADAAGVPFLNIGARADVLRGEACRRAVFHVEASDAMYAAALEALPSRPVGARAALWHSSLERFGASQLNDRFRARYAAEMDGPAWAGWIAVKLLWEASLRARSTTAAALLAYLQAPATQFDGHKGWPLSFRPWDHQLRQPLYLVQGEGPAATLVGEVPTRSDTDETPSRDVLDRLAGSASATTCRFTPGVTR